MSECFLQRSCTWQHCWQEAGFLREFSKPSDVAESLFFRSQMAVFGDCCGGHFEKNGGTNYGTMEVVISPHKYAL